ncbi:lipase family protein [Pseudoduganella namucuonensis]|uniref:Secretory lipase n=1 Tax=Pseudoduganella namucuonensis TaxID=1035707 RepID=A0A1I7LS03_9BURK|nr:lipase family protein [Pseudoduganella namucuonensis]SFV12452.1 Secretory lipase [Pseudoduganella namucuonensis]
MKIKPRDHCGGTAIAKGPTGLARSFARALLCLAMAGLSASPASAGPIDDPRTDAFYTPPQPLPAVPHGTLIRSRPFIPVGLFASGWQIMYTSTDNAGKAMAVTGTVLVPLTPWWQGNRPVIAWAPGTQGSADNCAPSHQIARGTEYETPIGIARTIAKGWAIAMTDYQGMGTPGAPTYFAGKPTGSAVLDAVLAAQQLNGAGVAANSPVGIMGYSEGGYASAAAAELQPRYAPTLNVKGVASGAAPYRIADVYATVNGSLNAGFGPGFLIGMDATYPELDLQSILTPYGKSVVADALDKKCTVDLVLGYPFLSDAVMVQGPTILNRPNWVARMDENNGGQGVPAVPALLYGGVLDNVVPYEQNKKWFAAWCARGANVEFRTVHGTVDHISGAVLGVPIALDWMAQRFAGIPATSGCP